MKNYIKNNFKVISVLVIVILLAAIGITFAYTMDAINVTMGTGNYAVVYSGSATLPSSDLQPILDNDLTNSSNSSKVLKIDFTVKGDSSNPTDVPIIYDVSLTDLNLPEELKNKYFKWRLYKNGNVLSEGNFSYDFDSIVDNRMVLTNIQQDLPSYDDTADSYTFYIWISESCTGTIDTCAEFYDQSDMLNKTFSGNIRIELSTKGKKELVRPKMSAYATLLALNLTDSIKTDTPNFSKTSCSSGCAEATVGIYSMEDDLGTSYYFRGDVENNYVSFANKYWRIIRINGDGTVRMIYDGTSAHANGESSTDRIVGSDAFNENSDDNTYVGYMYGTADATTYAETHSNKYDSNIKTYLENIWYASTIVDTEYEQYIADAIYCNDRDVDDENYPYPEYMYGIGGNDTIYMFASRNLVGNLTLKCKTQNDRFTYSESVGGVLGNGKLKAPVGLITADEAFMSGVTNTYPEGIQLNYLYTGSSFWTMTADSSGGDDPHISYMPVVHGDGYYWVEPVDNYEVGIRPVITLYSDALKYSSTSNGSMDNPFTVTG